jgi:hypothetical protein
MSTRPRPSAVASGLLARPGSAPTRSTPVEDLPRPALPAAPVLPEVIPEPAKEPTPVASSVSGGIKAATIGTTVYFLPEEHKRVKRLALDLDVPSVHELILMGLDRLLEERGERRLERYSQPRPRKG